MHGLPIESWAEHELGFENKKDIEVSGIGAFIERCKQFALAHGKDIMSEQFKSLGVWMNLMILTRPSCPNILKWHGDTETGR